MLSSVHVTLRPMSSLFLQQLHVETERLQLADEDVERLGETRIVRNLAFDDGLVNLRAAFDVVRLRR